MQVVARANDGTFLWMFLLFLIGIYFKWWSTGIMLFLIVYVFFLNFNANFLAPADNITVEERRRFFRGGIAIGFVAGIMICIFAAYMVRH